MRGDTNIAAMANSIPTFTWSAFNPIDRPIRLKKMRHVNMSADPIYLNQKEFQSD